MRPNIHALLALSLCLLLIACSDDSTSSADAKVTTGDGPTADTGPAKDTGAKDTGAKDSKGVDQAAAEAGAPDLAIADMATLDSAVPDSAASDAMAADTAPAGDMGNAAPPNKVSATNLVLWLTASAGVTKSGTKVTIWKDQSGNGLDAKATSGYEPTFVAASTGLNSKPVLQMSKSYLTCGNSSKFNIATPTMIAVYSGVTGGISLTKSFGSGGKGWRKLELNFKSFRSGADSNAIAHKATMSNANILALVSASDTSHTIAVNGTATTSTGTLYHSTFNTAEFKIGGSKAGVSSMTGQIAEVILYKKALSTAERKKIECYLAAKYSIKTTGCP